VTNEEARAKRAAAAVVSWTKERDKAIAVLRAQGVSLRVIGEIVGLSHTAVDKIANRSQS